MIIKELKQAIADLPDTYEVVVGHSPQGIQALTIARAETALLVLGVPGHGFLFPESEEEKFGKLALPALVLRPRV